MARNKKPNDDKKIRKPRAIGIIPDQEKKDITEQEQKPLSVVIPINRATEKSKSNKEKEEKGPAYKVEVNDYLVKDFIDDEKSKLGIKDAARALVAADGYVTRAARILKVNYATLKKLIDKTATLKVVMEDVIESTNDLAESKLKQQIAAGNLSAIIFHLKCKGRHRGWVEDETKSNLAKEQKPITFEYKLVQTKGDVEKLMTAQEKIAKESVSA